LLLSGPSKRGKNFGAIFQNKDKNSNAFLHYTHRKKVSEVLPNLELLPFIDVLQHRVPKIIIFNQVPPGYRQISLNT
jgi:hypothetical protein